MSISSWFLHKQKVVTYVIYSVLALASLILWLPQVQILIISLSELIPFLILVLVGLIQFETDQTKNFKLWFMVNFTLVFLAFLAISNTNLFYSNFAFNRIFRIELFKIPLIFIFSWINLVLATMVFVKTLKLKNQKLENFYASGILFLLSCFVAVILDKLKLVIVSSFFESIQAFVLCLFVSFFAVFSFSSLNIKTPRNILLHSSIFQLVILFWFYFFKIV